MKHKKIIILTVVTLMSTLILSAQQQPQKSAAASKPAQAPIKLTSETDSSQYILGTYMGQHLKAKGLTITNANLFLRGMAVY